MMPLTPNKTDYVRFEHPLRSLGDLPVGREVLDELLQGYRRPNDKVSEWIREGALLPLRRGLYLAGHGLRNGPACLPLLANHLYGPSYASLDFALAWHGLIPDGVVEVTSVTPKAARNISNSLGRFTYQHLPLRYYPIGQQLGEGPAGLSFLIASPSKALCDRLVLSRQLPLLSRAAMRQWLLEDLRLEPDALSTISAQEIRQYLASGFKRRQLGTLLTVVQSLQQELG